MVGSEKNYKFDLRVKGLSTCLCMFMYCSVICIIYNGGNVFLFLQLANTEEFIDGALTGNLGEVLIR